VTTDKLREYNQLNLLQLRNLFPT